MTDNSESLPNLVLIRGLPGSGKSTIAQQMGEQGYIHIESDMYFLVKGKYVFNPLKTDDAHKWCQKEVRVALKLGRKVVVSNTFVRLKEMQPYLLMTSKVEIIHAKGCWANIHGVSAAAIERMAEQWEVLDSAQLKSRIVMR